MPGKKTAAITRARSGAAPTASPFTAEDLVLNLLMGLGGPLSVQALCRAGALFGIRAGTIRVALTRMQRQRKIRSTGRARYAWIPGASALSGRLEDWARHFDRPRAWNGAWIGIHDAGVPRSNKALWRRHARALALHGFATLAPRLHVRPDNLAGGVDRLRDALRAHGLAPQAAVFRIDSLDDERHARACRLWDRAALLRGYRSLRARLVAHARALRRLAPDDAARESLLVGREAVTEFMRDPLLPGEIAPAAAREELLATLRDYQRTALRIWQDWLAADAHPPRVATGRLRNRSRHGPLRG